MSITITSQQNDAIKTAAQWFKNWAGQSHFSLEGYAGSGKSTILPHIIDACGLSEHQVAFCAPTGQAAKVMTTKLDGAIASTVHSLIYTPKILPIEKLLSQVSILKLQYETAVKEGKLTPAQLLKSKEDWKMARKALNRAYDYDDGPQFTLNVMSRIRKYRLIVCDEASMMNDLIASDLKAFNIPVLAMGDSGQLPPIEGSPGLLKGRPDFFLSEIHRQALDNPIIRLATMARQGEYIDYGDYGDGVLVVSKKDDKYTDDPELNSMVICGTHKKRWKLTKKVRAAYGYDEYYPCEGEPLLVCKNFRKNDTILHVNGELVTCIEDATNMTHGDPSFRIKFEDEFSNKRSYEAYAGLFEEHQYRKRNKTSCQKEFAYKSRQNNLNIDWGWAITCHKSQGSQFESTVVHDESQVFREEANRWLYTALTRSSSKMVVVR